MRIGKYMKEQFDKIFKKLDDMPSENFNDRVNGYVKDMKKDEPNMYTSNNGLHNNEVRLLHLVEKVGNTKALELLKTIKWSVHFNERRLQDHDLLCQAFIWNEFGEYSFWNKLNLDILKYLKKEEL